MCFIDIVGFDVMLKDYGGHLLPTVVQLLTDEVSVLWRLRKQDFKTKVVTTWISPLLTDILMRKDIMKVFMNRERGGGEGKGDGREGGEEKREYEGKIEIEEESNNSIINNVNCSILIIDHCSASAFR